MLTNQKKQPMIRTSPAFTRTNLRSTTGRLTGSEFSSFYRAALGALTLCLGSLTLTSAQSLSASLSFPQFNSSYLSGTDINIQATATTPPGTTITKVEFYYDAAFSGTYTKIGEDLTAPYSLTWTAPAVPATGRSYQLRAVVTNSASATAIQAGTGYAGISVYPTAGYTNSRAWYVSASASATNTAGTEASPFNTIQKAADRVAPGDIVYVREGTYINATPDAGDAVVIRRTGNPSQPIVFTNYPNEKPRIKFTGYQGFNLLPASAYLNIQGFEIEGNSANLNLSEALTQPGSCSNPGTALAKFNGNGISVSGRTGGNLRPHHIMIANNIVHDCPGGGVSAIESDYVTVDNNTIYNTSWYTIFGSSGISFLNTWNYDSHADGTPSMIIRNNRTFRNQLYVPWVHGTPRTCDIYDGNGIILDNNNGTFNQNPLGAYTGKFLIENNLSYLNGGRGINLNYTDNVTLLNNTTYQNGASSGGPRVGVESELIMTRSSSARIYNNIFYGRANEKTIDITNATDVLHNNNLTFGGTGTSYFTGAQNKTGVDPQFVNAPTMVDFDSPNAALVPVSDFQLAATSPALNAGSTTPGQYTTKDILGVDRPQGVGVDMGAYERQSDNPLPGSFAIAGVTTVSCSTVSAGLRSVRFTPQYAGLPAQPVSFEVVNELLPTTNAGPYTLNLYTDNPVVTLKAVQQGTVGAVSFSYNWLATCNGSPFAVTAVSTVSCATVSAGLRSVSFTPQYAGLNGQPVSFSVVNELSPTTNPGPYTLRLYTDNPVVTLKALQTGTAGEVAFSYNWLAACNGGSGRLGVEEPRGPLAVRLLGNPVGELMVVEITGAGGQVLQLQLTDSKGRTLENRLVEPAAGVEQHVFDLRRMGTGILLLRVSTNRQTESVKVLKQ